jgi:hypothetical protein
LSTETQIPRPRRPFATPSSVSPEILRTAFNPSAASSPGFAGRTQQDVMTYMTIPSTISGGPSIFQVHLGSGEVLTAGDEADVLVAFLPAQL